MPRLWAFAARLSQQLTSLALYPSARSDSCPSAALCLATLGPCRATTPSGWSAGSVTSVICSASWLGERTKAVLQQHMVFTPLAVFAAQAAQATSRSAPRLRLLKSPVTLTEAAAGRIKQLLNKRQKVRPAAVLHMTSCSCEYQCCCVQDCTTLLLKLQPVSIQEYLKLGIKRRGCNGLAYTLNYSGGAARPCMKRCHARHVACTDGSVFSMQDSAACKLILPMRRVIRLHCLVTRGSTVSTLLLP